MTCHHAWTPTPADAMSALALAGRCQCIKCHAIATEDDMRAYGAGIKRDQTFGEVMRDYDPLELRTISHP